MRVGQSARRACRPKRRKVDVTFLVYYFSGARGGRPPPTAPIAPPPGRSTTVGGGGGSLYLRWYIRLRCIRRSRSTFRQISCAWGGAIESGTQWLQSLPPLPQDVGCSLAVCHMKPSSCVFEFALHSCRYRTRRFNKSFLCSLSGPSLGCETDKGFKSGPPWRWPRCSEGYAWSKGASASMGHTM